MDCGNENWRWEMEDGRKLRSEMLLKKERRELRWRRERRMRHLISFEQLEEERSDKMSERQSDS